jgi:tetratricopeptide (TPR) repeat protein
VRLLHLLAALPISSLPPDDFEEEVRRLAAVYEAGKGRSEERVAEGRCEEAGRALIEAVPEKERTPAHNLVLGNLLAPIDAGLSRRFHRLAFESKPEEPLVLVEWALELHRSGSHAEAEALYRKYIEGSGEGHPRFHALRADCLLRLGRIEEGLEAWGKSGPGRFGAEIVESLSWIRPDASPWIRRCALLAEVRAGRTDRIEPLILLDLGWGAEGGDPDSREVLLARDLALAKGTFGAESRRARLLEVLARAPEAPSPESPAALPAESKPESADLLHHGEETEASTPGPISRRDFEVQLRTLRVLGPEPTLPESSATARALLERVLDLELATPERLLLDFEVPLRERAERGSGDVEALRLLAGLYERSGNPRLAEVDRIGWEKHRDRRSAANVLSKRVETLRSDDPLLERALREFPEEPRILSIAVDWARREGRPLRDLLVRQVLARFRQPGSWSELRGAVAALEAEVGGSRAGAAATRPR